MRDEKKIKYLEDEIERLRDLESWAERTGNLGSNTIRGIIQRRREFIDELWNELMEKPDEG